jgi:hypothetical protein
MPRKTNALRYGQEFTISRSIVQLCTVPNIYDESLGVY